MASTDTELDTLGLSKEVLLECLRDAIEIVKNAESDDHSPAQNLRKVFDTLVEIRAEIEASEMLADDEDFDDDEGEDEEDDEDEEDEEDEEEGDDDTEEADEP